jgi:hypothetical protein
VVPKGLPLPELLASPNEETTAPGMLPPELNSFGNLELLLKEYFCLEEELLMT